MDDYTLMTTESMALVLNDDGCCIRHSNIRLKETDENGDVYLKEACPLCQQEYASSQDTLLKKRRELSSQIESLQEEQEPPSLTKEKDVSLQDLAGHMAHIQQMQDILLFQKEKEVTQLRRKVEEQQTLLTEKSVEIALLQERMATQKLEMEKELKIIKRAVALDRERRLNTDNNKDAAPDIRIDNLIVHANEGATPRDIHDAAAQAVQQQQQQQQAPEISSSHARSDSASTEDTPHTTNGTLTGMGAAVAASSPPPSPKQKETPRSRSPRQPNRYESKGETPATLPPESTEPEMLELTDEKEEETTSTPSPSRVQALAQELNRKQSLEFVPPNQHSGAPATLKPKNRNTTTNDMDKMEYIPDNVGVGIPMKQEKEQYASSLNEGNVVAQGVAKIPEEMWEKEDKVESEEEDDFDMQEDLGHEPGNIVLDKKKPSSLSSSSYKKQGPLTKHLMETKAMEHPNERRKDPLEASVGSLKPPGDRTFQPASTALPTLSDLPPPNVHHRGPIDEFEIDEAAPPKVPLEEQVTMDSAFIKPSDRFEPRVAVVAAREDEGTIGQDTAGPTVASSTYGEDRMVVKDQLLLDPYGDKGIYSGQVLLSTGLPHGSGKMIYEDDGRTYDGDWRHGRWHGWGRATFSNGDAFEGFYKYDQRHGHGKYAWKDGRIYEGDFKEDKRHGKGHFIWPDGAEYTGDFRNGQREGHGAYRFSDGGRYEGDWINGRYEGRGRCEWSDGRIYEGEWKTGMAHGVGVETYPDGRIRHSGKWIKDEPIRE